MKIFSGENHWRLIWRQSAAQVLALIVSGSCGLAFAQETPPLQDIKVEERPASLANPSQPAIWTVLRSWAQHERALPGWNASVTRVDAIAPGRGHISVCGESGYAAFISSSYMDAQNKLDLSIGVVDMKTGSARELKTTLSVDPVQLGPAKPATLSALRFDESARGAFSLRCAPDASKVFVELNSTSPLPSASAKWLVLVDLKGKKGIATRGVIFPSGIPGTGSAIDTEAAYILAPLSFSNAARSVGLETVAADVSATFAALPGPRGGSRIYSTASGFWVEKYSQDATAGTSIRQRLLAYIPKLGHGAFTCGIEAQNGELQALGGELALVQHPAGDRVANVQLLAPTAPSRREGACSLSGVVKVPLVPGQETAVGGLLDKLIKVSYRKPRSDVATMNLTFSRHLQTGEFHVAIPFHGLNEEDGPETPIWAVDSTKENAVTFVYGPVGRGTALIHFWRSR